MTSLPDPAAIKACLVTLLDKEVTVEELPRAAVTLRREGRGGLVVAELVASGRAALDGYVVVGAETARVVGCNLLLMPVPDPADPMPDACLEAMQEVFNVLSGALNQVAAPEHWVLGRTTKERGAQALDPLLATCRAVRTARVKCPGLDAGLLAIVVGPPLVGL